MKNREKCIILTVAILLATIVFCLSAFAEGTVEVETDGELISAFGGEEIIEKFGDTFLLKDDVLLSAPIKITRGEYKIDGGDCTVCSGYESDDPMITLGKGASLMLGSRDGEDREGTLSLSSSGNGSLVRTEEGSVLLIGRGTVLSSETQGAIDNGGEAELVGVSAKGGNMLIVNTGKMTLTDCRFENVKGVISNYGELMAEGCSYSSCSSDLGGVLYNEGSAKAVSCKFISCSAENGGAVYNKGSYSEASSTYKDCNAFSGGAIFNGIGGKAVICGVFAGNCKAEQNGGFAYNEAEMILSSDGMIDSSEARLGGGIYNGEDGRLYLSGPMIASCKAEYGGGVFNLGFAEHSLGSLTMNEAKAGSALLNAGTLSMTGSPVVEESNSVFVLLDGTDAHAIGVDGAVTAPKTAFVSCGTENDGVYKNVINNKTLLLRGDFASEKHGAFLLEDGNGRIGKDGRIEGRRDLALIFGVAGGIILIVAVVLIVVIMRKRKKGGSVAK